MAYVNENYLNLQGSYLFANIARKVTTIARNILMRILFDLASEM